MRNAIAAFSTAAMLSAGVAYTAGAADLPETTIKVVGNYSTVIQTKNVEKPFWTKTIGEKSNGKIKVE